MRRCVGPSVRRCVRPWSVGRTPRHIAVRSVGRSAWLVGRTPDTTYCAVGLDYWSVGLLGSGSGTIYSFTIYVRNNHYSCTTRMLHCSMSRQHLLGNDRPHSTWHAHRPGVTICARARSVSSVGRLGRSARSVGSVSLLALTLARAAHRDWRQVLVRPIFWWLLRLHVHAIQLNLPTHTHARALQC